MAQHLHKKCIASVCAVIYNTRVGVNDMCMMRVHQVCAAYNDTRAEVNEHCNMMITLQHAQRIRQLFCCFLFVCLLEVLSKSNCRMIYGERRIKKLIDSGMGNYHFYLASQR